MAVHASAFISAEDLAPLHAAARRRADALVDTSAAPPPDMASLAAHVPAAKRPSQSSSPDLPSDSAEEAPAAVLSRLLPYHATVAVALQRVTIQLLDEVHPGVADASASPAALAERRKHAARRAAKRPIAAAARAGRVSIKRRRGAQRVASEGRGGLSEDRPEEWATVASTSLQSATSVLSQASFQSAMSANVSGALSSCSYFGAYLRRRSMVSNNSSSLPADACLHLCTMWPCMPEAVLMAIL
jgi:hypothetical protein